MAKGSSGISGTVWQDKKQNNSISSPEENSEENAQEKKLLGEQIEIKKKKEVKISSLFLFKEVSHFVK